MMLKKLFQRTTVQVNTNELDYNKLPVMNAEELIQFTGQQNRVRSIKRIVQIDDRHWQTMYLEPIYNFAELVQLMPASQAHHHAVPGGLLIHTLEVIEQALNLRKKYTLPAFAEQEVQNRERHAWTYAVFAAAILHDIGKRITLCSFVTDNNTAHGAFDGNLSATSHRYYKIVFLDTKFHAMHEQIGLSLIDVLPSLGKSFLFSHLNIVKDMMSYIHGEHRTDNVIAEIIKLADQHSTGNSLLHSPTQKFKGANIENIGQRIMTQLRQMVASNDFIINKANANIYTTKEGYTYGVSKVIVDGIREEMAKNNENDIPTDNNRIFDIFQEFGLAETNPLTGKLIHNICIYHNGTTRVFTVLKFKTNNLFMTTPSHFEGVIEEVANKDVVTSHQQQQATVKNSPNPDAENNASNIQADAEIKNSSNSVTEQQPVKNEIESSSTNLVDELIDELVPDSCETAPVPKAPDAVADIRTTAKSVADTNNSETKTVANTKAAPVKDISELDKKMADDFINWCRKQILEKHIVINESGGQIQKINYKGESVIAVVTPRIFSEFAQILGLPNPTDKATFAKVQSAIHKAKLNIPAFKGQVHVSKIVKSIHNPMGGNIKIRHYLFSIDTFCGDNTELKEIINSVSENTNMRNI